jgi:hypothetical protein
MKKILLDIFSENKNIIYILAIITLFFAHWLNIRIIFLILSFFHVINICTFKNNCTIKEKKVYYFSIIFSVFTIIFVRYIIFLDTVVDYNYSDRISTYSFLNLDRNNLRLLLVFLNPFIVLSSFIAFKKISLTNIKKIALSFFLISTLTILLEFIGINFLNISNNIIPTYKENIAFTNTYFGFYIPFGLTGNAAANGGLILLSMILLHELKLINKKIIVIFIISSLFTISGQAFLVNLFYLNYLFLKNNNLNIDLKTRIFLILFFALIIYFSAYPILQQKLEINYIKNVLFDNARLQDIFNLELKYRLFGQWGTNINNVKEATELFYIYQIKEFGLIFSLSYYLIIYFLFKNTKYSFFVFFILFASNLHYPILLAFESWLIIIFIYFASEKRFIEKKGVLKKN